MFCTPCAKASHAGVKPFPIKSYRKIRKIDKKPYETGVPSAPPFLRSNSRNPLFQVAFNAVSTQQKGFRLGRGNTCKNNRRKTQIRLMFPKIIRNALCPKSVFSVILARQSRFYAAKYRADIYAYHSKGIRLHFLEMQNCHNRFRNYDCFCSVVKFFVCRYFFKISRYEFLFGLVPR